MRVFRQFSCILLLTLFTAKVFAQQVWIDVRTAFEHKLDNIKGDIQISHGEIVEQVSTLYPDKNIELHLYCRSGNRAGKALIALKAAGYKNVTNEGSIGDARAKRQLK